MTDSFSMPTDPFAVPSGRRARGRVRVPSSKSMTHRYFNLALLSGSPAVIERPLYAEDTRLFLDALGRCGFRVEEGEDEVRLDPTGPPSEETNSISRSIFSSISSEAASRNTPIIGTSTSRNM